MCQCGAWDVGIAALLDCGGGDIHLSFRIVNKVHVFCFTDVWPVVDTIGQFKNS